MTIERRIRPLEVEARTDGDHHAVITGYAALFNSRSADLGGFVEEIAPGAFAKTLRESDTKFLFNHDESTVMARSSAGNLRVSEDADGLHYEARIDLRDPDAERLFRKIGGGNVRGSSFAFRTIKDEWSTTDDDYPLRTLREVGPLFDVSSVTTPAYPETEGLLAAAVRSLAAQMNRPVEDLVVAARANELRSMMDPADLPDETEPPERHSSRLSVARARLELLRHSGAA